MFFTDLISTVKITFSGALQPKLGLDHLIADVSIWHTVGYTHSVGLLATSYHFVPESANFTTRTDQTSMPSEGFELAIPAIKRPQTYALDCMVTVIGWMYIIHRYLPTYKSGFCGGHVCSVCVWPSSSAWTYGLALFDMKVFTKICRAVLISRRTGPLCAPMDKQSACVLNKLQRTPSRILCTALLSAACLILLV
jgi:hypothetical protein